MKRKTSRLLTLIIVVCMLMSQVYIPVNAGATFAGGTGTAEDPYQISTAEQLNEIRNHIDKHFILVNDIDLNRYSEGAGWLPIWNSLANTGFMGSLDGGEEQHEISNLTINRYDEDGLVEDNTGLFAVLESGSQIKNIKLTNINVYGEKYAGSICGYNYGSISNSSVSGTINGGEYTGGLAGANEGVITYSSFSGSVYGYDEVGGLSGINGGVITYSSFSGSVYGYDEVGGLSGINWGVITYSNSSGLVKGETRMSTRIGGLVGFNTPNGCISYSISSSRVTGWTEQPTFLSLVGGLVGENEGSISYSISSSLVNGAFTVGGIAGLNRGNISNSKSSESVNGFLRVGGLAGANVGSISNSSSSSTVIGTDYYSVVTNNLTSSEDIGGLVGGNDGSGSISNSYATGTVNGNADVGGLVGGNGGSISNSYAAGTVNGNDDIGGLVGYTLSSSIIKNSYARCAVSGLSNYGGLVGRKAASYTPSITESSYWDMNASGIDVSASGEGKPSGEMKQKETYAEWDFDTVWCINKDNEGYPFLRWQTDLYDSVSPVLSDIDIKNITFESAVLDLTSNETGFYYYLVYTNDVPAPDETTIKEQSSGLIRSTGQIVQGLNSINLSALSRGTTYNVYLVVEDIYGNFTDIVLKSFISKQIGDVNNDGAVNNQDATFLRRYLIGGWGVTIDPVASDVNKDGFINNQDVTLLRRYLIGGWGVTLD